MKLLHIMGAMALVLATATVAAAQGEQQGSPPPPPPGQMGPGGPGHMGGRHDMAAALLKGITLTDAQKDSLRKLGAAQGAEMQELAKSFNGGRPDSAGKAQMRAMHEKHRAQMRAILTADQQAVFDKNVADMHAMMQKRMQEHGMAHP